MFGVLFLCLSRACLGKMFVFIYKWLEKTVFGILQVLISTRGVDEIPMKVKPTFNYAIPLLSKPRTLVTVHRGRIFTDYAT